MQILHLTTSVNQPVFVPVHQISCCEYYTRDVYKDTWWGWDKKISTEYGTVITLNNGKRVYCKESPQQVIDLLLEFNKDKK